MYTLVKLACKVVLVFGSTGWMMMVRKGDHDDDDDNDDGRDGT